MQENWFKEWFNTPYYHILYQNRDESEAEKFIHQLVKYLNPSPESKFLDIACGKGRHSIQINKMNFHVVGYDLSEESIQIANKNANANLEFYVHDMRNLFRTNYFDFALNLFTSFGYFQNQRDELKALNSASIALKKGGKLVVDFLNKDKVINTLVKSEIKNINDITFKINRNVLENKIIKDIRFNDNGESYHFQEKVNLLSLENFKMYFERVGLKIIAVFGNYDLSSHHQNSDRLILIAEKL